MIVQVFTDCYYTYSIRACFGTSCQCMDECGMVKPYDQEHVLFQENPFALEA